MSKRKMISTSFATASGLWEGFPDPHGISLKGTEGDDALQGGLGHDTLDGAAGNDSLLGGAGNDTYIWGRDGGSDVIHDAFGTDAVHIDAASTAVILSADTDDGSLLIRLNGSTLRIKDYFHVIGIPEHLEVGHIEKLVFSDGAVWDLDKVLEILSKPQPGPNPAGKVLTGTDADETLIGTDFGDTISGGAGTDLLEGGYGDDVYIWRPGHDVDVVRDYGGVDKVLIDATPDQLRFFGRLGEKGYPLIIKFGDDQLGIEGYFSEAPYKNGQIEKLVFSNGIEWTLEDVLAVLEEVPNPTPEGEFILGTEKNDTLQGGNGDDTLDGALGDDALFGGKGDDVYVWNPGSGNDLIQDAGGSDTAYIAAASSAVALSSHLDGTLVISLSGQNLTIRNYLATGAEGRHIEHLVFSDGVTWNRGDVLEILNRPNPPPSKDLYLVGTEGDDTLRGGQGHDTFDGGRGDDALFGGMGNDVYVWGEAKGFDLIEDAGGIDTVQIEAVSTAVKLQMHLDGTLVISLGDSALTIRNYLATSENGGHVERLAFSDGAVWNLDKVLEILSAPKPNPEPEPDPIPEPEGEIVIGQKGNDVLLGTLDDDTLMGGIGHDTLDGGAGNDILIGGQGKDVLTGGTGEDFFVFTKNADLGTDGKRDTITDFEAGLDIIDLGKLDANSSTKKNDAFKVLLKGKAAFTKAGQLHYDSKKGILSGNTDKDAEAEFQILLKNKPKALKLDDFIL